MPTSIIPDGAYKFSTGVSGDEMIVMHWDS